MSRNLTFYTKLLPTLNHKSYKRNRDKYTFCPNLLPKTRGKKMVSFEAQVSKQNRITIPRQVRKQLDIQYGDHVKAEVTKMELVEAKDAAKEA